MASWISDRNDYTVFDLRVAQILSSKLLVIWHFGSGEDDQNTF